MKTITVINKQISKELELDESVTSAINNFYWKEIRKKLAELDTQTIYIKEIGTVTISRYKLYKHIYYFINRYRNVEKKPYSESVKESIRQEIKLILTKLLKFRNSIAIEYYDKTKRNN